MGSLNNCTIYFKYVNIISILLQAGARGSCIEWRSMVRVLLRHSVVVASPKRIVINHTQLFTIRFGTSVPKSKSGSYISLFVLELSLPNRREKADLPQFVLEQIEKPRTFRFGTCPPNPREDAKAEIGFTI